MAEYLIAFNGEWVPDLPDEWFRERVRVLRPLIAEMREAGVLVFTGGLEPEPPLFSVDPTSGTTVFTDGPFVETKEHLGGFTVVDVETEEELRHWAGRIAEGCAWPMEISRFQRPFQPIENE